MRTLLFIILTLIASTSIAAEPTQLFDDKPYVLNLGYLQLLDPKPLQVEAFSPDPSNPEQVKGFRIISRGRVFPVAYEVISITGGKPEVMDLTSSALDEREGIVLKEFIKCSFSERCLHYFHRVSENGKPHHVSSNYLFVKNNTFFHFSASNYGALVMPRESWGDPKPDRNAEKEVMFLLQAAAFK
jgi:hypothetical protein